MSLSTDTPPSSLSRMSAAWNAFWFTPQDPTLLGLIRILVGSITLYTFVVQGFMLKDFLGKDAWYDLQLRSEMVSDRPISTPGTLLFDPRQSYESRPVPPNNDLQGKWLREYQEKWKVVPPSPHPETLVEADYALDFRARHGFDFRMSGLPFPKTDWEKSVLENFAAKHHGPFPPPYPKTVEDVDKIDSYIDKHGYDPRRIYSRGMPIFSVWLHVIDPDWMWVVQALCVGVALCFMLGLGTRVTSALVWFSNLCYIHRNPAMLFGVDTMMTVLLLYLMIGPSGAALSLDRLISKWWAGAKSRFFPGSPPANYSPTPLPSVSANLALRLMQIHLCIIYFVSGISKLQGQSWWAGTAVWGVLGNPEFAPMDLEIYTDMLRFLAQNQLLFDLCITGAGLFTLGFEISYPYLIWRPSTRWFFLAGAIFLHGFIGVFMGLKTFSLMMLVFNMAFLKKEEALWIVSWFSSSSEVAATPAKSPRVRPELAAK